MNGKRTICVYASLCVSNIETKIKKKKVARTRDSSDKGNILYRFIDKWSKTIIVGEIETSHGKTNRMDQSWYE